MKTFFEAVSELPDIDLSPFIKSTFKNYVVVNIDNVAEYLDNSKQNLLEVLRDYPMTVPPFQQMWFEYKIVTRYALKKLSYRIGFLVDRIPFAEAPEIERRGFAPDMEAKWHVKIACFVQEDDKFWLARREPELLYIYAVGEDGKIVVQKNQPQFFYVPSKRLLSYMGDASTSVFPAIVSPFFMAVALMHCKNVSLDDVEPVPYEQGKRHRHDRPQIAYKVLKIKPMGGNKRGISRWIGSTGSPSLHIRRGHFKNYTESAPLFGKFIGTYWWEASVVGKPDTKVEKTYRIFPPDEQ